MLVAPIYIECKEQDASKEQCAESIKKHMGKGQRDHVMSITYIRLASEIINLPTLKRAQNASLRTSHVITSEKHLHQENKILPITEQIVTPSFSICIQMTSARTPSLTLIPYLPRNIRKYREGILPSLPHKKCFYCPLSNQPTSLCATKCK